METLNYFKTDHLIKHSVEFSEYSDCPLYALFGFPAVGSTNPLSLYLCNASRVLQSVKIAPQPWSGFHRTIKSLSGVKFYLTIENTPFVRVITITTASNIKVYMSVTEDGNSCIILPALLQASKYINLASILYHSLGTYTSFLALPLPQGSLRIPFVISDTFTINKLS
jgi:hypothetical protein